MYLSPEEKAIGKVNFNAAIGSKHVRREFLMKGIKAGVASGRGLGPMYFGYDEKLADPVRVGVIGTGDEGSVLIGAINPRYITVKAIADIRPYNVHRAFHGDYFGEVAMKTRPGLMAVYEWQSEDAAKKEVKVYGAYQDMLENAKADGLEAVIIALPLHLHAPAAVAAMKAGLHVITEKLMAHSVHECKEMARVAKQADLLLAVGHQRHYNILYENSVEMIRKGMLGELHCIRAQWHRGNLPGNDSWQQPLPENAKPSDKQAKRLAKELKEWQQAKVDAEDKLRKAKSSEKETLRAEINVWTKKVAQRQAQIADEILKDTAKNHGYVDLQLKDDAGKVVYDRPAIEELIRWRLWDRTGAGLMAELGSHQLDAASIFIAAMHDGKKQHPLSVSAAANRPLFPADRDVEDHVYCVFEFPAPGFNPKDADASRKKIGVQYASINGNGFGGYGETVFGTEGTLVLETEKEAMLFKGAETAAKTKVVLDKKAGRKEPGPTLAVAESTDEESAAIGQLGTLPAERGYTEELEHWAWCIRNRAPENLPRCHAKVAMGDAVIALTTNMAARKGARIEFNEAWFDAQSDETPEGEKPDLGRYSK
jgi:predicted dehydrogenase